MLLLVLIQLASHRGDTLILRRPGLALHLESSSLLFEFSNLVRRSLHLAGEIQSPQPIDFRPDRTSPPQSISVRMERRFKIVDQPKHIGALAQPFDLHRVEFRSTRHQGRESSPLGTRFRPGRSSSVREFRETARGL